MNLLLGIWLYSSLIYQGKPIPRPNPNLKMYYTFENESINEIFYFYEGESGFCRRKAKYHVESNTIFQEIIEVDPQNAQHCSQDTDMQMGNISKVNFNVVDNQLQLALPLGDEELIYIWEKQNKR